MNILEIFCGLFNKFRRESHIPTPRLNNFIFRPKENLFSSGSLKGLHLVVKQGEFEGVWEQRKCDYRLKSQPAHSQKFQRRGRDSNSRWYKYHNGFRDRPETTPAPLLKFGSCLSNQALP